MAKRERAPLGCATTGLLVVGGLVIAALLAQLVWNIGARIVDGVEHSQGAEDRERSRDRHEREEAREAERLRLNDEIASAYAQKITNYKLVETNLDRTVYFSVREDVDIVDADLGCGSKNQCFTSRVMPIDACLNLTGTVFYENQNGMAEMMPSISYGPVKAGEVIDARFGLPSVATFTGHGFTCE